ncbi:MAG: TolC family outer membrane protein [Rhodospirillales bacterium]
MNNRACAAGRVGVAALSLFFLSAVAPVALGQTLQQELQSLLTTHPRLKAETSNVAAATEGIRRAGAGYLPSAVLSGDVGRETIDDPITRGRNETSELTREKITLSVTQNLFNGFATHERKGWATAQRDVAQETQEAARQSLLLEGITAYYAVLRQSKLVAVARENEDTIQQQAALEDERVQRGAGIAVDVLLAKTRLQLAKERRVQLQGNLNEAVARYIQVFDHPPDVAQMTEPNLRLDMVPESFDVAVGSAYDKNPVLRGSSRQIDVAERNRGIAEAEYYPSVDLVGRLNWENNVDALEGVRRDWAVLLRLNWSLFNGFATDAAVAAAAYSRAAAMDTHGYNRRKVIEDLRIAWEQLATARERVRLLDNAVAISEEVFVARRRLRDAGRETAINVLDAQSEVFAARLNYLAAVYDVQIASFRVLFVMGILTPETIGL